MLRQTFAQFFTNGVFGNPGTTLELSKGEGLKVNVAQGLAIINGAMGAVPEGGLTVPLTDESPTVGTYAYGVFLRYDENSDKRSCYLTVRKGDAGPTPTPPDPDRTSPGIWEMRLGYIIVPTGATNLSDATIKNEKGLDVCPFAAPFEEIDTSAIINDVKNASEEEYREFVAYLEKNMEFIQSAIDGTTAGNLQNQIDQLKEEVESFDLSDSVDDVTIGFSTDVLGGKKKLNLKDDSVTSEKIRNGAVTTEKMENLSVIRDKIANSAIDESKLSDEIKILLELYDWSSATAEEIIQYMESDDERIATAAQENIMSVSWDEVLRYKDLGKQEIILGKAKKIEFSGFGSFLFQFVGFDDTPKSDGTGNAAYTLRAAEAIVERKLMDSWTTYYVDSSTCEWVESTLVPSLQENLRSRLVEVKRGASDNYGSVKEGTFKIYPPNKEDLGTMHQGINNIAENRVSYQVDTQTAVVYWGLENAQNSFQRSNFVIVNGSGSIGNYLPTNSAWFAPFMCLD